MFTLGVNIGLMSFFSGIKPSKQDLDAVRAYPCSIPFSIFKPRHAKVSAGSISVVMFALVLNVARCCNITKIFKRIVFSISVYVINVVRRPVSCHVKPSKATGAVPRAINPYDSVTIWPNVSSLRSGHDFSASFFCPRKNSGFRVIIKNFLKPLDGKLRFSHV